MDLYAKSQQLLEALANSIHDREPRALQPFFFNAAEIQVAEKWLKGFMEELENSALVEKCPDYESPEH